MTSAACQRATPLTRPAWARRHRHRRRRRRRQMMSRRLAANLHPRPHQTRHGSRHRRRRRTRHGSRHRRRRRAMLGNRRRRRRHRRRTIRDSRRRRSRRRHQMMARGSRRRRQDGRPLPHPTCHRPSRSRAGRHRRRHRRRHSRRHSRRRRRSRGKIRRSDGRESASPASACEGRCGAAHARRRTGRRTHREAWAATCRGGRGGAIGGDDSSSGRVVSHNSARPCLLKRTPCGEHPKGETTPMGTRMGPHSVPPSALRRRRHWSLERHAHSHQAREGRAAYGRDTPSIARAWSWLGPGRRASQSPIPMMHRPLRTGTAYRSHSQLTVRGATGQLQPVTGFAYTPSGPGELHFYR